MMTRKKGYYWVIIATSNKEEIAYYDGKHWNLMACKSGLFNENIIKKCGACVGDSFMCEKSNELSPLVNGACDCEIVDVRNEVIESGYMCIKCGRLFKAHDH